MASVQRRQHRIKRAIVQCEEVIVSASLTELHVFMAQHSREDVCDFKVFGNYSDRMCTVSLANSSAAIAQMSRKYTVTNLLLHKDTFKVTVFPNVDCAFIIALIVILDEITKK
ncbi:Protein LURP-one-related 15 [Acorus calamus]|uniref:Protein LURP-one-related 15 n=1 Tax=Acorus calamus TaxID=4465 RepID=A0AAV9C4N0_ACOCL|nr:Protein LURP-one-related 15 [Acorus calamus]